MGRYLDIAKKLEARQHAAEPTRARRGEADRPKQEASEAELRQPRKRDFLPRPLGQEDAREDESEAVTWLRSRLATPQRIADLMRVWGDPVVGRSSREISTRIDLLNDARWALGVEAYIGQDERFWWRLPQEAVH